MKLALATTVLLAASLPGCLNDQGELCNTGNDCYLGNDNGTSGSSTGPAFPYILEGNKWFNCPNVCPIAVGGTRAIVISRQGWDVTADVDGVFEVQSNEVAGEDLVVRVRATQAGTGRIHLHATRPDPDDGLRTYDANDTDSYWQLTAAVIDDLRLTTSTEQFGEHDFATDLVAYRPSQLVGLRLLANRNGLTDESVHLAAGTDPGVTIPFSTKGQYVLPEDVGTHHIVVEGDSFLPRAFDVQVAGSATRVEGEVQEVHPITGGTNALVCFHAYWNDHEIMRDIAIDRSEPSLQYFGIGLMNCLRIIAPTSGTYPVTATVDGLTASVDLVIPPMN